MHQPLEGRLAVRSSARFTRVCTVVTPSDAKTFTGGSRPPHRPVTWVLRQAHPEEAQALWTTQTLPTHTAKRNVPMEGVGGWESMHSTLLWDLFEQAPR